jgi:PHD/YefM family antitoxin component YafN of YafNO toxin-antitoxin module
MDGSVVPAKDVSRMLPRILNRLSSDESVFITDATGRAKAVLLDIDKYHAMMDALEDEAGGPDAAVAGALLRAILGRARKI